MCSGYRIKPEPNIVKFVGLHLFSARFIILITFIFYQYFSFSNYWAKLGSSHLQNSKW